jgi:formylglycine-generating enzyme
MRIQSASVPRRRGEGDGEPRRPGRLHSASGLVLAGAAVLVAAGYRLGGFGAEVTTFAVRADQIWQDTGIDVAPGATVRLAAEGTWHRDGQPASAAGLEGAPRELAVLPDAPLMCVLARVGDDAPLALVGPRELTPTKASRLFAQVNDLEPERNAGSVTLRVEGGRGATGAAPAPPLLAVQELEREYRTLREQARTDKPDVARDLVLAFCAEHLGTSHARRAAAEILSHLPPLVNSLGLRLRPIPPGEFVMGDAKIVDASPHTVTLTRPFFLGEDEVTVGQFRQFVAATLYRTEAEKEGRSSRYFPPDADWRPDRGASWQSPGFAQTVDHPVVHVSWNDAMAFCDWLSRKEGQRYRLPTEAEWEYACRAGSTTPYYWGSDRQAAREYANLADATLKKAYPGWHYYMNPWDDGHAHTAPVGSYRPNAWGLYDMSGNALEWCADRYGREYYATSEPADPPGPEKGGSRVLRGAAWSNEVGYARSAFRLGIHVPSAHNALIGFRVARLMPASGRP